MRMFWSETGNEDIGERIRINERVRGEMESQI
jgi:hypothetical protein